jgi:DNA-binding NarL/FixJ family response regulator
VTADGAIRVVVVDDHVLIRDGIRALLESTPGIDLVGEAADGHQAIAVTTQLEPDVVLMDLHMPNLDGISATREIVRAAPGAVVLVVSMLDDDASVFAAMRAGARGYVLKGAERDELTRAIAAVARGDVLFGPGVAERVLALFADWPATGGSAPAVDARPFPALTEREREVLDLLARGLSNGTIGQRLAVSPRTVANHVSNILTKLHATDRTEVAIRARNAGLGHPPTSP